MEKKVVLEGCSTPTAKWSETHVRQVWLGTFFSGKLNCLVSWKRDLILQCLSQRFCSYFTYKTYILHAYRETVVLAPYTFKWKMSFFFSATLFRVDSKRLNKFCILTRRIKITNMLFLIFLQTGLHYYYYFFFSATHHVDIFFFLN